MLLPLHLATDAGDLAFHSTMTKFGAPHDVTLAELALESFFPADAPTRDALHAWPTRPERARSGLGSFKITVPRSSGDPLRGRGR